MAWYAKGIYSEAGNDLLLKAYKMYSGGVYTSAGCIVTGGGVTAEYLEDIKLFVVWDILRPEHLEKFDWKLIATDNNALKKLIDSMREELTV